MQNEPSSHMTEYSAPGCQVVDMAPAGPLMGSYYIPPIGPADADPSEFFGQ